MARRVYAVLPSILVAVVLLLVQGSHCSRPLPAEERQPRVPTAPSPEAHRDNEPPYYPYHPDATAETGTRPAIAGDDGGKTRADDDGGAAPSSPRDEEQDGGAVVVSSGHGRRSALLAGPPPPVPRRSKLLARRVLPAGVVEGGDSAARASCRSSDAHIGCAPPAEH